MRNMKKSLYVIAAILGCALPAGALDLKEITSMPTADNPQFSNKQVWPALAGDEYFLKEKWPKARLLVWAYPGESERRQGPKFLTVDPACWIDAATGKPADAIPDMDTDVILPDSEKPYTADTGPTNVLTCRHLTIGRNAVLRSWVGGNFSVFGSILVRPTGKLQPSILKLLGNRDTFIRMDWPADGVLKKAHDERRVTPYDPKAGVREQPWWSNLITVYMTHEKEPGKSTEVVGYASAADEVGIKSGAFIVGRGSRFVSMDVFKKWKNISFGDACLSKDPAELVRGYEAEIATMKNAGPMSPLEPKPKFTTN